MTENPTPLTYCIWVENHPGVLLRLCTLFNRRKINIESITASETEEEGVARFTIVVVIPFSLAVKITRQIDRMIEVLRVSVHRESALVYREVALYRIASQHRDAVPALLKRFDAKIIHEDERSTVIEKSGDEQEITALLKAAQNFGLIEFIRSGHVAFTRECVEVQREGCASVQLLSHAHL